MRKFLCMALLPMALAACAGSSNPQEDTAMTPPPAGGGGTAGTHPGILQALEDSGAIPRLERGDSLEGTDADGNGIRDDVDAYILERYGSDPVQLAAVRQFARAMQAAVMFSSDDREDARKVAHQSSKGIGCVFDKFEGADSHKVTREITAITTNTKRRLVSYLKYNKMLSGMVFTLPQGDGCE